MVEAETAAEAAVGAAAVRRGADGQLEVHELACVDRKLLQSAPADAQTRVSFDHLYVAPTAEPMRRIRVHRRVSCPTRSRLGRPRRI